MLNQKVIDQFLARKLASYDWMKSLSVATLDNELMGLCPAPDFGPRIKLWQHQKACLLLLLELKRFMFFVDMGGGKTLLTLMLLKYRKQRGEKPKAIVFVPYITSVDTWVEETAKFCPDLKCVPLLSSTSENLTRLGSEGDLFVICYHSAICMLSRKDTGKWVLDPATVRIHLADFDTLVCDEIHRCKSHSSLTYKMCKAVSSTAEYVLGLTGTPFGRDLGDLWPQFNLIDFGKTLGPTLGLYRGAFFNLKINYWGGYEYTFKPKLMPLLKQTIKNASISYNIDEFYDMPPKEYVIKNLPAPDDSKGYIEHAIKELRLGIKEKDYHLINNSYLRLRQLSSGFLTLRGEDNDKLQIQFEQNPKLEALVELLEGIPVGCKIVVLHHFVFSSGVLSNKLRELKIKHARIWGGQKDPIGELHKFKQDPDCRVLVLNWRSGSASLNLQNANYMLIYEQPDSPIDRKQGEARLWRPGQAKRVMIYDLLVRGTVDHRLNTANANDVNLLEELLNGKDTI